MHRLFHAQNEVFSLLPVIRHRNRNVQHQLLKHREIYWSAYHYFSAISLKFAQTAILEHYKAFTLALIMMV